MAMETPIFPKKDTKMARILIIDDELILCKYLIGVFRDTTHEVHFTHTLSDGINILSQSCFDVVILDVGLPDGSGLESLMQIKEAPSSPEIIIITGAADRAGAEVAIKNGAWDYIQKPFSATQIKDCLNAVLQYRLEKAAKPSGSFIHHNEIIGNSPQMKRCFAQLASAAFCDASVLITGQTGTGKELFAKAIHSNSHRKNRNFTVVDCAAMTESLVTSTLFGHEKGAFTGAERSQEGLIKQAHQGTLFLDEVGELPLSVQRIFLRVIQEHRFRPIGSRDEMESNFRLIAATNRDLKQMVEEGEFRQDLLYRLRSITIDLPPLRERTGDIENLASHYLKKFSQRYRIKDKKASPELMGMLIRYQWPGNVRELINAIEKSVSAARDSHTLFSKHLPTEIRVSLAQSSVKVPEKNLADLECQTGNIDSLPDLKNILASTERKYLQNLVSHTCGNVKKICAISGLSRSRIYDRLRKYNIPLHI